MTMRRIANGLLRRLNGIPRALVGLELRRVHAGVLDKSWFDRLLYFRRLLTLIENVEGDVVRWARAATRVGPAQRELLTSSSAGWRPGAAVLQEDGSVGKFYVRRTG
jgi:hypothetical protein